jgi:hypothetical protein
MMDDAIQPRRPARPDRKHVVTEAFGEDPSTASRRVADETARNNAKVNSLT